METNFTITTNVTRAFTHQITNPLLEIQPESTIAQIHNCLCIDLVIATSFIIAKVLESVHGEVMGDS